MPGSSPGTALPDRDGRAATGVAEQVSRFVVDRVGSVHTVTDGDVALAYEDAGAGEPALLIHGAFVADAFRPLFSEPPLADHRLIAYHRRGYGGSDPAPASMTLEEHAADCRAVLSHAGVLRAHVVGHSFGALVALQLALDAPELVGTLTLLEAGLLVGDSADLYRRGLEESVARYRDVGARVAVDEFFRCRWPAYREHLDRVVPGAFEQAVADAATCFEVDLPSGLAAELGEAHVRRVAQPTLVVLGEESLALHPRFGETYRLLLAWLPKAEGSVLPRASHFLQLEQPRAMAEALAAFFRRHPL
jgi:pimeloyl-ACP methyl ester carboxylesterase